MRAALGACLAVLCLSSANAHGQAGPWMSGAPPDEQTILAGPVRRLHPIPAMHVLTASRSPAGAIAAPDLPMDVGFESGSARLTPSATRALDRLGPFLGTVHLRLDGYADPSGAPDARKDLALRRADAVAHYLEQNFGVAASRLQCVGSGTGGHTRTGLHVRSVHLFHVGNS